MPLSLFYKDNYLYSIKTSQQTNLPTKRLKQHSIEFFPLQHEHVFIILFFFFLNHYLRKREIEPKSIQRYAASYNWIYIESQ